MDWEVQASGYAAVWATENTREAIFDAMQTARDLRHDRPAHGGALLRRLGLRGEGRGDRAAGRGIGYTKGVPMGGDLSKAAPAGKAPTFLVAALRDPIGANLDRSRSSRAGWTRRASCTSASTTSPVSGGRKIGADGRCKASVGSTVDVENATWTNTIGAPELIAVWKDPDFDAEAARLLLRSRDRDPDAALDRLRREALRREADARARR